MPRPPEADALTAVSDVLQSLSASLAATEDDLLSSLVVMGESDAQQVVDGWVDQVVDVLRAVDEVAVQHRTTLARASSRQSARHVAETDRGLPQAADDTLSWEHR